MERTGNRWSTLTGIDDPRDIHNAGLARLFPDIPCTLVAGLDEAGRGCLAGPVVAAAVILPRTFDLPGLDDSKVVPAELRDSLAARIGQIAPAWSLGVVWPREIDRMNILQATLFAMSQAVATLRVRPEALVIDGNARIPDRLLVRAGVKHLPAQQTVVDGDARVPVISAASILAKSFRDTLMEKLDARYPGYGFAVNKGYGTAMHRAALERLGPCRMHRRTFHGVLPEKPATAEKDTKIQGRLC